MASVSFTYNIDYDPNNTARLLGNNPFALLYDTPNSPYVMYNAGTSFAFNKYQDSSQGGYIFLDNNRHNEMGVPKTISAQEYSLDLNFLDNVGSVNFTGGNFGDILRAGSGDDILNGGAGDDVLEGGLGGNVIDGGSGINTISYENYAGDQDGRGVYVKLDTGRTSNLGVYELQDDFSNIQNIIGSSGSDLILGDGGNNALSGGSGNDELSGRAGDDTVRGGTGTDSLRGESGNDRLVIEETPALISGGDDKDFLFVTGGGSVSLTESTFKEIEAVYVRNDTHLDMSAVDTGTRITSQSTAGHGVEIIGTAGNDAIKGGKGADTLDGGLGNDRIQAGGGGAQIDGGEGGDKLFGGAGSDIFHFQAAFGRDNVYGLDVNSDHITVDIAGIEAADVTLRSFGDGNTLVTFIGVETGNKIILHDVTLAEAQAHQSDLFTFGA